MLEPGCSTSQLLPRRWDRTINKMDLQQGLGKLSMGSIHKSILAGLGLGKDCMGQRWRLLAYRFAR